MTEHHDKWLEVIGLLELSKYHSRVAIGKLTYAITKLKKAREELTKAAESIRLNK